MAVRTPSPQTTLLILLGASEWPYSPEFPASKAFRNSAREVTRYLLDSSQFGLPPENLLNLFDSNHSSDDIDQEIGQFITTRMEEMKQDGQPATDLLVYFIGHGGFVGNDTEFYLAIRRTRTENPTASGIRVTSLAYTLKEKARYLRRIVILDCCFAGAAFRAFQASGPAQVAIVKTVDAFEVHGKGVGLPERGTSLLCSSRHNAPSLLSKDGTYTLFTLALVRAFSKGHPRRPDRLSLRDIADLTADVLHEMPEENAPRPEVHSPDQSDGDVANVPFFPNPTMGRAHPENPLPIPDSELGSLNQPPPTTRPHSQSNSLSLLTQVIRTFSRGKFLFVGLVITLLFLTGIIGIPIYTNYVYNISPSARHTGQAALGVSVASVDAGLITQDKLSVNHGALIMSVTPHGPADQAGLRSGDVIVQFDNKPVNDILSLSNALGSKRPGDVVSVHVYRGPQQLTVSVRLGEWPKTDAATATAAVAATATMVVKNPDPYPPYTGRLTLYDPLSQPDQWDNTSNSSFSGVCQFTNGAYHISQSKPSLNPCDSSSSSNLSNFAFEVQMTIIKGDCGGIEFRYDSTKGSSYDFQVCQDGSYRLSLYRDYTAANAKALTSKSSSAIRTGLGQSNLIAVVANGSTFDLYVNTQKIDSVNDATYSRGEIGLLAEDENNPTEVVYRNAKVWTI